MTKVILHPTDFSPRSNQALEVAVQLARQNQSQLVVAHVVSLPTPPPLPYNEAALAAEEETRKEDIPAMMDAIQNHYSDVEITTTTLEGKPADQIISLARETECDMIVMGTHGHGVRKLLMGSVSEEVMRKAPCQVIPVRTPEMEPSVS